MTQMFGNNQTFVILEVLESPKIACAVAYSSEPSPGITITSEYISTLAVIDFTDCNTVTLLSLLQALFPNHLIQYQWYHIQIYGRRDAV